MTCFPAKAQPLSASFLQHQRFNGSCSIIAIFCEEKTALLVNEAPSETYLAPGDGTFIQRRKQAYHVHTLLWYERRLRIMQDHVSKMP